MGACSSAGRAPRLHRGCRRFDPGRAHQHTPTWVIRVGVFCFTYEISHGSSELCGDVFYLLESPTIAAFELAPKRRGVDPDGVRDGSVSSSCAPDQHMGARAELNVCITLWCATSLDAGSCSAHEDSLRTKRTRMQTICPNCSFLLICLVASQPCLIIMKQLSSQQFTSIREKRRVLHS